jgi:hypothetical protein
MRTRKLTKAGHFLFGISLVLTSATAFATANYTGPAAAWTLQNISRTGVSVRLLNTSAPCTQGRLTLDPQDTPDRNKLLWATVLAAKASGSSMSFDYDIGANDICYIRNFAVVPG